jgi:hypothetical protein
VTRLSEVAFSLIGTLGLGDDAEFDLALNAPRINFSPAIHLANGSFSLNVPYGASAFAGVTMGLHFELVMQMDYNNKMTVMMNGEYEAEKEWLSFDGVLDSWPHPFGFDWLEIGETEALVVISPSKVQGLQPTKIVSLKSTVRLTSGDFSTDVSFCGLVSDIGSAFVLERFNVRNIGEFFCSLISSDTDGECVYAGADPKAERVGVGFWVEQYIELEEGHELYWCVQGIAPHTNASHDQPVEESNVNVGPFEVYPQTRQRGHETKLHHVSLFGGETHRVEVRFVGPPCLHEPYALTHHTGVGDEHCERNAYAEFP